MIEKSYARSGHAMPGTLLDDLRAERRMLWLVVHDYDKIIGAGVTAMFDIASGKMLKIEHFGGENMLRATRLCIDAIEDYAKSQGCVKVMIEGRTGWRRKLDDYRQTAVILEKSL
jgi:hypothetical protein